MSKAPKIIQAENADEVPAEIIAQSIAAIAEGMKAFDRSRLSRRAILLLIHDQSKVPLRDIALVLNNLEQLEKIWLKPKATKQ